MKAIKKITTVCAVFMCSLLVSCEDYLEIEAPDHKIVSETVFDSDETAESVMTGIYNQLSSASFSGGGIGSITVLSGLSGDNLMPTYETNIPYMEFERHEITTDNFKNAGIWSSSYNMIYLTNTILEGISNSGSISKEVEDRLTGEAKFVRAFVYFYLVNLYGEVPLVLQTGYQANSVVSRDPEAVIYEQIVNDLSDAINILGDNYTSGERIQVNRVAALSLMARVQLYLQNWGEANKYSTLAIDNGQYEILQDLDQVFLANSREAIWQLSPEGRGYGSTNTNEGSSFIIHPFFYFLAQFELEPSLITSYSSGDQRLEHWTELHSGTGMYYPHKYKVQFSTEDKSEYSMVLRLAEQYLIRAEARVMLGDLSGAIQDLDVIRERAGIPTIAETNPGIGKTELLDLIIEERNKELFTEWGHRWLDLKRTGKAGDILGSTTWQDTDLLYPIPESERVKNPNLTQNNGY